MNITFIGYGAMAKAIASGLLKQGTHHLSASSPSLIPGLSADGIQYFCDNRLAIENADMIILAVKPMIMREVLEQISPHFPKDCCLISVAAGLTLSWFAKYCPKGTPVIRTMPNLPAQVGFAATPMIANSEVSAWQHQAAELIFSSIGITTWVDQELDMDTLTALSGSGPAYVFLFMQSMIDAAVQLGLNEQVAKLFTEQTVQGALMLSKQGDLSLNQLQTKVTSPKGTTAAALACLHHTLPRLIFEAMSAAKGRAHELGAIDNN